MAYDDDGGSGSHAFAILKGVFLTLGALMALGLALSFGFFLIKSVIFFGVIGGAGYIGYRMLAGGGDKPKAVSGGRRQRALGRGNSSDEFDRKMRELDAIEKRLDAEIGKH